MDVAQNGELWGDMSFRGEYSSTIDEKGRVNIPAKLRRVMPTEAQDTVAVVLGPNKCLRVYPINVWTSTAEAALRKLPETPENLKYKRMMTKALTDSVIDGQGRINLSQLQMQVTGIAKNVKLVGHFDCIEIWDAENYDAYMGDFSDFDEIFADVVKSENHS